MCSSSRRPSPSRQESAIKQLIVIRHAKSSWEDPGLKDIDRPLNPRGQRDAPVMGGVLRDAGRVPDVLLCSPAVRARMTARAIAAAAGLSDDRIQVADRLYGFGLDGLLKVIEALEARWDRVALIGHNPDLTALVEYLTGERVVHLPTCSLTGIEWAVDDWEHLMPGAGRAFFYDDPKRHRAAS